jgi:hypothetical protein
MSQKSNSSNETPNVMTVGVEKYGLSIKFEKKLFLENNNFLKKIENFDQQN